MLPNGFTEFAPLSFLSFTVLQLYLYDFAGPHSGILTISFYVCITLPLTALLLPLSVLTLVTQRSITMVMGAN